MSIISLENVTKRYPGAKEAAVDDISMEIDEGEFVCLLGPSGCGKSTTLRMISGLESLSDGKITIEGKVVDDVAAGTRVPAEGRKLSLVFQSYALWPHMKVYENVEFGPRCQKLSRDEVKKRAQEAMRTLSIEQYAERYPSEMSGGQQQRVAIARTLASKRNIMLLDEPLSNLDARLRLEMRSEFQRIHQETGATMIFVTHDQWEAMTLATRIVVMNEGTIQQSGTPLEIYQRPANRFVAGFMGSPPINIVEAGIDDGPGNRLKDWLRAEGVTATSAGARPEDINFSSRDQMPPGALGIDVRVTGVLPTGGSWIIESSDGTNRYFGTSTRRPDLVFDQDTVAWAAREDLHIFDAAGDRVEIN